MGDAPRLTDEAVAAILREFKPLSAEAMMAKEIIERRAQSEGQAKVVEAARLQAIKECVAICQAEAEKLKLQSDEANASGNTDQMYRENTALHSVWNIIAALSPPRQTEEKTHE